MTDARLLDLVDSADFSTLFIDELGWSKPDVRQPITLTDDTTHTLTNVASYRGLRIWVCPSLPSRAAQRRIDAQIGHTNHERLVIFSGDRTQEWRWPRRAQLGAANAKLVVHEHIIGDRSSPLTGRLATVRIGITDRPTLVELLDRMRDAFDTEAEKASVAAARLMGALYTELERAGVGEHESTLLLARLLFLMFGDDATMWEPPNLFEQWLREHTTPASLASDLHTLFTVLDTEPHDRTLPDDSPYRSFRYVNGGLFADPLRLPTLTAGFRTSLIDACDFDWSIISPAVFGSMFQTVKTKEARRHGGEHYTTEENILKTLRPLFLDDYRDRLTRSWNDKAQLTKLHNELGRLRFLDPACGCGNFLIVAYRELRALELELLVRRRELDIEQAPKSKTSPEQLSMDVSHDIKVRLDHFYGIEIEEWPRRIAETAMLLVDHLANQTMAAEFGIAPDRLPIQIAPTIHHNNALHLDWRSVLTPSPDVIIVGNPPFGGDRKLDAQQKADLRHAWGGQFTSHLDYVTGWFAKALNFYGTDIHGRWAFVATNSICQGEPVADLWPPLLEKGWRCRFAHRSFRWTTEAVTGQAAVHVSIVGFDRNRTNPTPQLWTYPEGGNGAPTLLTPGNISPYLGVGPNVIVTNRSTPLAPNLPTIMFGNMARDGGKLIITTDDYDDAMSDPIARKYVRRFIGTDEMLYGKDRWCLWLVDATTDDMTRSPFLRDRIEATRNNRLASKAASTRNMAKTAHLFAQRTQPPGDVLAVPKLVSEHRRYFTVEHLSDGIIVSDLLFAAPDPDALTFAILSSSMFIAWMRAVGGRLESRLRFSKLFTYNNFPLQLLTDTQQEDLISAGQNVMHTRSSHPDMTLAQLYDPSAMPTDLVDAHDTLDHAMDSAFDIPANPTTEERQTWLFERYTQMSGASDLLT